MFALSYMPTWDSLHPLIIHFPIALLFLSPLFILIGAVLPAPKGKPYMIAALIVLLLGTVSIFVSTSTGQAAAELAERGGQVNAVLESHEDLAKETQFIFAGLFAILLGIFSLPRMLRRKDTRLFSTFLPIAFLALYSVGVVFLINTAHAGGRLVHEFGVHAMLPAGGSPPANAVESDKTVRQEDKD